MTFSGEYVRRFTVVLISAVAALSLIFALGSMRASAAPRSDGTEAVPTPCATSTATVSPAQAAGVAAQAAAATWSCSVASTTPSATAATTSAGNDVDALALTDDPSSTSADHGTSAVAASGLAFTGVAVLSILSIAGVLLVVGLGFVFTGRRRARHI